MRAAQQLYEGIDIGGETVGLITYMRTDGVQTAPEALDEARDVIGGLYGRDYVPEKARIYSTKAKNAPGGAREAIRPTSLARNPGKLRLEPDLGRLYGRLIWKRMIASQMEKRADRAHDYRPGKQRREDRAAVASRATSPSSTAIWRSTRKAVTTPMRKAVSKLPAVAQGLRPGPSPPAPTSTSPSRRRAVRKQSFGQEDGVELGIGRPSTYASVR